MGWSIDGKFSPWRSKRLFLLGGCGMIDFAGFSVVHMASDIAAIIASCFVGPLQRHYGLKARAPMLGSSLSPSERSVGSYSEPAGTVSIESRRFKAMAV